MAGEGGVFGSLDMFGGITQGNDNALSNFLQDIATNGITLNSDFFKSYKTGGSIFINYHKNIGSNAFYLRPINSPSSLFTELYKKP